MTMTVSQATATSALCPSVTRISHNWVHYHCEIQVDYEYRSSTTGYRFQYENDGEVFQTRTRSAPGEVIRLEVSVRPVG